jgi:uncharacterized protein YjbI with pentapeptide repeats
VPELISIVGATIRVRLMGLRVRLFQRSLDRRFQGASLFVAVSFAVAGGLAVAVLCWWVLRLVLHPNSTAPDPIDLTKVSLSIVAGVGGAVALVVAYRRQRDLEQGRYVERFGAAAAQLGATDVAVRIAGVYAMAGAADEARTDQQRQQCIDVLCGYLRLPYQPSYGANYRTTTTVAGTRTTDGQTTEHRYEYRQNDREVRKTIIRIIAAHLQRDVESSWSLYNFDFRSAELEDVDFNWAIFAGTVRFDRTQFHGEQTSFQNAQFHRATSFQMAKFHGEQTTFDNAKFHGERTTFGNTEFHGEQTTFDNAKFHAKQTSFHNAQFRSEDTIFEGAEFHGEDTWFGAQFHSRQTTFGNTYFRSNQTWFDHAEFHGVLTTFNNAKFRGELTTFENARFDSERTYFGYAQFRSGITSFRFSPFRGELTTFEKAEFYGGLTTFVAAEFHSEQTSFQNAQFHSARTSFNQVEFHGGLTTFVAAQFHSKETSFEDPGAWTNVTFDWGAEPPLATEAPKPASVLPADWPPEVK